MGGEGKEGRKGEGKEKEMATVPEVSGIKKSEALLLIPSPTFPSPDGHF